MGPVRDVAGVKPEPGFTEVRPGWLDEPPDWVTPKVHDRLAKLYDLQRESGLSLVELAGTFMYGLPDDERILRPKLPGGLRYAPPDSGTGEVDVQGRRFSCPIKVGKEPGVYTLVVWIQHKFEGKAFMATNISILVE